MSELTHSEVITTVDMDSLFDQPETVEVDDVFTSQDTVSNSNSSLDLEDIPSIEFSAEDIEKVESELYLSKGLYKWIKAPSIKASYIDQDKRPTDIMQQLYIKTGNSKYDKGRMIINLSGVVENIDSGKKGLFRFSYSPDYRTYVNKIDNKDSNEGDMLTKSFAGLTNFYFQKYERRAKDIPKDLNLMLASAAYHMYITLNKDGNANYLGKLQEA